MGRPYQLYEMLCKGTCTQKDKTDYAWGRAIIIIIIFFGRALSTHRGHVCGETDMLGWACNELKWRRAKALLLRII